MAEGSGPLIERQPAAVLVVGSLHYDILVEASNRPIKGETLVGKAWRPKCGGKGGNQAIAAQRQDVATAIVSAVGRDAFGDALLANLDKMGVKRSGVKLVDGLGSGMSVAMFDSDGDYGAIIVSGANLAISAEDVSEELLRQAKVLVLQNEIPESVNAELARRARQAGVLTILNAAPARIFETDIAKNIDILVVNAIEAEAYGGGAVDSLVAASAAARHLTQLVEAVVVTAGGCGLAFAKRSRLSVTLPAIPVEVVSTHGAGDVFVGSMAARLACGEDVGAALDLANREAARLVAGLANA